MSSIDQDRFGVFPTTKRFLLIVTLFRAYLPCCGPLQRVVTIKLVSWKSNYHRYLGMPTRRRLKEDSQFCQVYQDIPSCNVTFEIDDNAVTKNRFTKENVTEDTDTLTLTATNPHHIRIYLERRGSGRFGVIFGQCFGQDWIHLINSSSVLFDAGQSMAK